MLTSPGWHVRRAPASRSGRIRHPFVVTEPDGTQVVVRHMDRGHNRWRCVACDLWTNTPDDCDHLHHVAAFLAKPKEN